MTSKEFVIWMKGFLKACEIANWSDQLSQIEDKLDEVGDPICPVPTPQEEVDNWNIYNRTTKSKDILHD